VGLLTLDFREEGEYRKRSNRTDRHKETKIMKSLVNNKKVAGNALLVCLLATAIVGIILGAYLTLIKAQTQSVARSQVWNTTVSLIEAGMEEALAHLNAHGETNLACDGWQLSGTKYVQQPRAVGDGFYVVSIENWFAGTNSTPIIESRAFTTPPVLVASAEGLIPFVADAGGNNPFVTGGKIARGVRAQTTRNSLFSKGLVAKGQIDLKGNNIQTDSFDSLDPAHRGIDGGYDPSKHKDNGDVATDSVLTNSISIGNADIYGKVSTGPKGTVSIGNGSVGNQAWHDAGNRGVQTGYAADDMNVAFPPASVPFAGGGYATAPEISTNGVSVYNGGNYRISSISLASKQKLIINGDVSIWVPNGFSMTGQAEIDIAPTGKLTIYTGAASSVGGNGVLNATTDASRCQIIGLPGCTSLAFGGNAGYIGTIYAPNADFSVSGGGTSSGSGTSYDFVGAAITKTVTMNGHFNFHYDEALRFRGPSRGFIVTSWNEMDPSDVRNVPVAGTTTTTTQILR